VFNPLYSFSAQVEDNPDGAYPAANLIQATDGYLYGTASTGGANDSGTIFRISLSGSFQTVYSFSSLDGNSDNSDGSDPQAALIQAADGNLYSTTYGGGSNGYGNIFKYNLSLNQLTTLYSFTNGWMESNRWLDWSRRRLAFSTALHPGVVLMWLKRSINTERYSG
jgi:uncharacterized repeat protein (TIGR03803 family)